MRGTARVGTLCGAALLVAALPVVPQTSSPVVTSLTLFAGTAAGLWRSQNWGGSWELARKGTVNAVLPMGSRVMVGADEGLVVSEDFGQSWKEAAVQSTVLGVLFSRYPQADPTVFLGTPAGLLKSEDGGRTFGPTPLGVSPVRRIEWPGPDLVVAAGAGVFVSGDSGRTFRGPGHGLPGAAVLALALSSYYAVDPVIFAGLEAGGVFRSADGGRTWTSAGLSGAAVHDLVWLGPFLFAATDDGLFRTEDVGRNWTRLGEGLKARSARRLLFPLAPASGIEAFLGTDQGIYHTTDGGLHWTVTGMKDQAVLALATFPAPESPLDKRKKR
jgi:photosystem II stability/assembly factor-like uncharacterized protein